MWYVNESLYFAVVAVELPRRLRSEYSYNRHMQLSLGVADLAEKNFFFKK